MQVLLNIKEDKKHLRQHDIIAYDEKRKEWKIIPKMELLDFCVKQDDAIKKELIEAKERIESLEKENQKLKEHINNELEKMHKALQLLLKGE